MNDSDTCGSDNLRIAKSGSIVFSGLSFNHFITLLSGLIVARAVGPSIYGIFSIARDMSKITANITKIGLDIGMVRFFGETNSNLNHEKKQNVLRLVILFVFCLSLIPILFVYLGGGYLLETHVYKFPSFSKVIKIMLLIIPLFSLIKVMGGAFRGIFQIVPNVMADFFIQPGTRLIFILILFSINISIWAVLWGTVLSFAISFMYMSVQTYRKILLKQWWPQTQLPWKTFYKVAKYSSVMSTSYILDSLINRADLLMLGYFASIKEVGIYSVMLIIAPLIIISNTALSHLLAPLIAQSNSMKDINRLKNLATLHIKWVAVCSWPLFLLFALHGPTLITIFGDTFVAPPLPFIILASTQMLIGVTSLSGYLLSMTGHHFEEFLVLFLALIINVLLNYILIPLYGITGGVTATFISLFMANILRLILVYKFHGFCPINFTCIKPLLFASTSFLITFLPFFLNWFDLNIISLVISSIIFVFMYTIIMYKFIDSSDRILLETFASKARQYIR